MISRKELEEYAKARGIKNIGRAEKDYIQNILLFVIYQNFGSEWVFKGGTALAKCYGMNRFSEDLDFICKKEFDIKSVEEGLKRFKIEFEIKEEGKFEKSKSFSIRIKGPLYNGDRMSACKVILDCSFREEVMMKPLIKSIGRFLEEIPSFDVYVMSKEEIVAEKIRAILMRNKARDVYDLYFLIESGVKIDKEVVEKKLDYYQKKFNEEEFVQALNKKKEIWRSELSGVMEAVPDFDAVVKRIREAVKE